MPDFLTEVEAALAVLRNGGVLLYPTDTVWALGCDALNTDAVERVRRIKQHPVGEGLEVLAADERDVLQYVAAPDPAVTDFLATQQRPTTIIYPNAINLPENLLANDGSVAIRIVADPFCRHLIKRLRHPIVATAASQSGHTAPRSLAEVNEAVKASVDHVVRWQQQDHTTLQPSQLVRWNNDGSHQWLRR